MCLQYRIEEQLNESQRSMPAQYVLQSLVTIHCKGTAAEQLRQVVSQTANCLRGGQRSATGITVARILRKISDSFVGLAVEGPEKPAKLRRLIFRKLVSQSNNPAV